MELSLRALILVMMGGAIGAPLRYAASELISRVLSQPAFPVATLAVNALGSFLLALLVWTPSGKLGISTDTRLLLGTGLLGAFTTYSTFSVETFVLIDRARHGLALSYVLTTVVLCAAAAYLGMQVARSYF